LKALAAALVVALVLLAAVALLAVDHLPFPSSRPSTETRSVTCNQPASGPNTSNLRNATVYHVTSTDATICVTWTFEYAGWGSFIHILQPWVQNGTWEDTPCGANPNRALSKMCFDPTVTAYPETANFSVGENVAVSYTIESSANTMGLYALFISPCDVLYLSFGSPPSTVYTNDYSCGPRTAIPQPSFALTGVTNIDVMSVPQA
jgi:hypothetical protein